jgi:putative hydrolase of the HAD superfamily
VAPTAAVFFDVDFTLIQPGPRFLGSGYRDSSARYGITVDPARFDAAVAGAASVLDVPDPLYDARVYVTYTRRIIELMGGEGPDLDRVASEIYDEWAEHHHFSLYDDVPGTFEALRALGIRLGLISNAHRCLDSFQAHFGLAGLISVTVTSSDHGYLKPHPEIFREALARMDVRPDEAAMVGDSLAHDIAGARNAGMRGILIARGNRQPPPDADVEVIRSLAELPGLLGAAVGGRGAAVGGRGFSPGTSGPVVGRGFSPGVPEDQS